MLQNAMAAPTEIPLRAPDRNGVSPHRVLIGMTCPRGRFADPSSKIVLDPPNVAGERAVGYRGMKLRVGGDESAVVRHCQCQIKTVVNRSTKCRR